MVPIFDLSVSLFLLHPEPMLVRPSSGVFLCDDGDGKTFGVRHAVTSVFVINTKKVLTLFQNAHPDACCLTHFIRSVPSCLTGIGLWS